MDDVKGWGGVGRMLSRPSWLFVLPTAVLAPSILFFVERGKMGEELAVAWSFGVVLLAMMVGVDKAKLRTVHGAKAEYVGSLAILGGFAGIPAMLLGMLLLWMFDMVHDDHAMAIGSAMGGVVSFVGLLAYAFVSGVSAKPASGRGGGYDGVYDGRD